MSPDRDRRAWRLRAGAPAQRAAGESNDRARRKPPNPKSGADAQIVRRSRYNSQSLSLRPQAPKKRPRIYRPPAGLASLSLRPPPRMVNRVKRLLPRSNTYRAGDDERAIYQPAGRLSTVHADIVAAVPEDARRKIVGTEQLQFLFQNLLHLRARTVRSRQHVGRVEPQRGALPARRPGNAQLERHMGAHAGGDKFDEPGLAHGLERIAHQDQAQASLSGDRLQLHKDAGPVRPPAFVQH